MVEKNHLDVVSHLGIWPVWLIPVVLVLLGLFFGQLRVMIAIERNHPGKPAAVVAGLGNDVLSVLLKLTEWQSFSAAAEVDSENMRTTLVYLNMTSVFFELDTRCRHAETTE